MLAGVDLFNASAALVSPDCRLTFNIGGSKTIEIRGEAFNAFNWFELGNPNTSFAAVRLHSDPTIEIVVPGGVILRVPAGTDATAVARLVLALRGASC